MSFTPVLATDGDQNELVIALVAAVGTDIGMVSDQVAIQLDEYGYACHQLRLSSYLAEQASTDFRGKPFDEELWEAMSAGDELRQSWERSDALVLHAISDIVTTRYEVNEIKPKKGDDPPPNLQRHAFVIRSLKTPDELETLRAVYGPRLIVIGAYSPRDRRLEHLTEQIEDSRKKSDREVWTYHPEELIDRDEREERERGQDVSGTFHRADFFIRGWDRSVIRADIKRTLEILFGEPFRTPTRDEHAQFMAGGAALRSSEYGRQVGAALANPEGSILAVGTNEVPRAGGGSPWEEDGGGTREFEFSEIDTNRKQFEELATLLVRRVGERINEVSSEFDAGDAEAVAKLRERLTGTLRDDLRAAGLKDLTEFGRAMHAEMSALLDAARRGVSVQDATLYTTTFPCHNCARHIIGAGIARVVFIEPYIKSRAGELHDDAVQIERSGESEAKICFEPFVGVAPRRYLEVFDAAARARLGHLPRHDGGGRRATFEKKSAIPVFSDAGLPQFRPDIREYRIKELLALEHFEKHSG